MLAVVVRALVPYGKHEADEAALEPGTMPGRLIGLLAHTARALKSTLRPEQPPLDAPPASARAAAAVLTDARCLPYGTIYASACRQAHSRKRADTCAQSAHPTRAEHGCTHRKHVCVYSRRGELARATRAAGRADGHALDRWFGRMAYRALPLQVSARAVDRAAPVRSLGIFRLLPRSCRNAVSQQHLRPRTD